MTSQPLTRDDIRHIIRDEMEILRNELREHYATNTSLTEVKGDLREESVKLEGDLRGELVELRGDLREGLVELRGDLGKDLSDTKGDLSREITSLQVSLKATFQTFYIVVGALNVGLAALTLVLKFFVG